MPLLDLFSAPHLAAHAVTRTGDVLESAPIKAIIRVLGALLLFALVAFIAVAVVYFQHFQGPLSNKNDDWGTFGDFVGGTLNPIFAFLSFLALVFTLLIQIRQLELARHQLQMSQEELKLTREETTRTAVAQEEAAQAMTAQAQTAISMGELQLQVLQQQMKATAAAVVASQIAALRVQVEYQSARIRELMEVHGYAEDVLEAPEAERERLVEEIERLAQQVHNAEP